jgi:homocysteine S-methyltransferase
MTVDPLQAFLSRQGFVMLDGGLATEMESRGADLEDDLWSAKMLIDAPEMIRLVHADFLKAGADVIATSTYQASFEGFRKAGYRHDQAERLMRLSVDLALLARETFWANKEYRHGRIRPLVAASIGPYGACLHDGSEYHGNYGLDKSALMDFHRPRMALLADSGADLFALETIPSLLEAEALLELMQEFPGNCAWLSFSCKDAEHVSYGERFSEGVALAEGSDQVVAVGLNCTAPEYVTDLLKSAEGVRTPLVVYPNSGEKWNPDGNQWTGEECATMPVLDWYDAGARMIGGCCRISIDEIASMRTSLIQHLLSLGVDDKPV